MLNLLDSAEFWKAMSLFAGVIALLAGYIAREFKADVKELKNRVADMDDRVNKIEALVYSVRQGCEACRSDIKEDLRRGEKRFDRIEEAVEKMSNAMQELSRNVAAVVEGMGWVKNSIERGHA